MVKRVQVHVLPGTGPMEVALALEAPDGTMKTLFVKKTSSRGLSAPWRVCRESPYCGGLREALEPKLEGLTTVTAIGRVWASHWAKEWNEPVVMAEWPHEATDAAGVEG